MLRFGYFLLGFLLLPNFALTQAVSTVPGPVLSVQPLDVKAGMHAPIALAQPDAEFPEAARQKELGGKCSISMVVDTVGMPRNVHVVRCSDPVFAPNCIESTSKYRFKPATSVDGTPVAVQIYIVVSFHMDGTRQPLDPIRYGFGSPPEVSSTSPDANGVYSLTKAMSGPTLSKFVDKGYGDRAFQMEGKSACDVLLTVGANGKLSEAKIMKCERESLEEPLVQSLLASKYKPGSVGGRPVAVRARMHIEYGEFAGQK